MSDIGSDVEEYRLHHTPQHSVHSNIPSTDNKNKSTPIIDFISGTCAGVAICVTGHPLDTLKVRLQTSTKYTSGMQLAQHTVLNEGIPGLYKGLSSPLLTVPLVNAIVFASYEHAKYTLTNYNQQHYNTTTLSHSQIGLCGAYAGLLNCIVACPVELIKNKLQIQYEQQKSHRLYTSPIHCIRHTINTLGYKGLSTGMTATVLREIPAYGFQFYAYEKCKSFIQQYNMKHYNTTELSHMAQLLCGGIGGISCWVFSYPQDVIKSKLQTVQYIIDTQHNVQRKPYYRHMLYDGGFTDCFRQTIRTDGVMGLWKGFGPCAARAFIANACGFYTYEYVLDMLSD